MFQSDLMADLRKVSQERDRIAKERKKFKGVGFISLLYLITNFFPISLN